MPRFDISSYQGTVHKVRPDYDDGHWGGANEPPRDLGVNDMQTNFKRTGIAVAGVATARSVTNDIRQTVVQRGGREDLDRVISTAQTASGYLLTGAGGFKIGGPFLAVGAVGFRAVSDASSEISRRKQLEIENYAREEERKLLGSAINNNQFKGAYYD